MAQHVRAVLEQVVSEIRAIAPGHVILTSFQIDEPVYCDPGRIGQLASNLLGNAVSHGSADGPIRVEAFTGSDAFVLSVANVGDPIPEEVRSQLFEPFFRGAQRASRNGLGLGLFIASEVARAHDGRLEVSSDEQQTRFTLTMPRSARVAGVQ